MEVSNEIMLFVEGFTNSQNDLRVTIEKSDCVDKFDVTIELRARSSQRFTCTKEQLEQITSTFKKALAE